MKLSTFSTHYSFLDIINMKSKIKQDNLIPTSITYHIQNPQILFQIVTPHNKSQPLFVLSLSLSFIYSQCNHHQNPPPPLIPSQSTTTASHKPKIHNTTKIRLTNASQNQIKPKTKKKKKKKPRNGAIRSASLTLGVVGFSFDRPP